MDAIEINNQKQTIQGVHISNREIFQQIRFTVENNHLEGWNPSKEEIEYLLSKATQADSELEKEYQNIFGE